MYSPLSITRVAQKSKFYPSLDFYRKIVIGTRRSYTTTRGLQKATGSYRKAAKATRRLRKCYKELSEYYRKENFTQNNH